MDSEKMDPKKLAEVRRLVGRRMDLYHHPIFYISDENAYSVSGRTGDEIRKERPVRRYDKHRDAGGTYIRVTGDRKVYSTSWVRDPYPVGGDIDY